MSAAKKIRCIDFVEVPYDDVCDALSKNLNVLFHLATTKASSRVESVAAALHTNIAGIEFARDIDIDIKSLEEIEGPLRKKKVIGLDWKAASSPMLFPTMSAKLHIYAIDKNKTRLDLRGEYVTPFGFLGKAVDALVGHRIVEETVKHFVAEVAEYLLKHQEPMDEVAKDSMDWAKSSE